jgi:chromate transporter
VTGSADPQSSPGAAVPPPSGRLADPDPIHPTTPGDLGEVARLAFKLGVTAFGGPAAHTAMLRDEVVNRRRWLSDATFLDMVGASNLIPGPTSTETVMHAGMERAGWRGLLTAGALFILPAALITLTFAWVYGAYGTTPTAGSLLYGIKPVVVAVVVQAIWGLGRTALKGWKLPALALTVLALALLGIDELALLLGSGMVLAIVAALPTLRRGAAVLLPTAPALEHLSPALLVQAAVGAGEPYSPFRLFLGFLKIGATLYGSPSSTRSSSSASAGSRPGSCSTRSPSASSPPARSSPPRPSLATSSAVGAARSPPHWRSSCRRSSWSVLPTA